MKTCTKCNISKDSTEFTLKSASRDGLQSHCKACDALRHKLPSTKKQKREHAQQLHIKDPRCQMLKNAVYRAQRDGVPCTVTVDDLVVPERCPILGIPLQVKIAKGCGPSPASPSLDRLIPEHGYIKGNIAVISHRANTIKNDATLEELLRVARYIKEQECHPTP